jgi:Zn-dependent alcohol dehydrogenase
MSNDRNYGDDWRCEELDLDDPREGEVMVRLTASGLCHSDEHVRLGDLPMADLPVIGGHEGAGIVEKVGANVHSVAEGCRWSTWRNRRNDAGASLG